MEEVEEEDADGFAAAAAAAAAAFRLDSSCAATAALAAMNVCPAERVKTGCADEEEEVSGEEV